MKLLRHLLVFAVFSGLLTACGQKGPLYLPDSSDSPASTAPAEDNEDDDGS
jgi:predicted small lipoprotein YifL